MVAHSHDCPVCEGPLERRTVSPCMECGGDPRELQHLADGTHNYARVRVFDRFSLILCDFCQIDFGTWPSYYFGMPRTRHLGFNDLTFAEEVPAKASEGDYCPDCGYRLPFLQFVVQVRAYFQDGE
ncbi:MAG: hypothetical protein AAF570_26995 [Bacteroidota bacterium]